MGTGAIPTGRLEAAGAVPRIAGLSTLKGLVLYGAIVSFAGLYLDFIVEITLAKAGTHPALDATLISTAAALAGILGSAFALEIGTTTDNGATNQTLSDAVEAANSTKEKTLARLWQALSLEPRNVKSASWPQTVGIWVYAIVATAMAITYVLNQNETPAAIKALAVAFAGYVLALVTAAYKTSG